jgi:hypothetical protein
MNVFFDSQAQQAQASHMQAAAQAIAYPQGQIAAPVHASSTQHNVLYPSLEEYMGLQITPDMVQRSLVVVPASTSQVSTTIADTLSNMQFNDRFSKSSSSSKCV